MNKKVLIIPDIHGRTFWRDAVKRNIDKVEKIVFLGDYLDPYPYEQINEHYAVTNLQNIIDLKRENKDKVVLLLGNHDWPYIMPQYFHTSRHSAFIEPLAHSTFMADIELFQMVYTHSIGTHRYVFSHAGIHPKWVNMYFDNTDIDEISSLFNCRPVDIPTYALDSLNCASSLRGGDAPAGSMTWADVREWSLVSHDPSTTHIFGHTQQLGRPIITHEYACLDCREAFILNAEGEIVEEDKS